MFATLVRTLRGARPGRARTRMAERRAARPPQPITDRVHGHLMAEQRTILADLDGAAAPPHADGALTAGLLVMGAAATDDATVESIEWATWYGAGLPCDEYGLGFRAAVLVCRELAGLPAAAL